MSKKSKAEQRKRRHVRIRKNLHGTSQRPRMFVYKSNRYFYVGIADDDKGVVLGSVSIKKEGDYGVKIVKDVTDLLKKHKVSEIIFDRSGYKFHGNIKKLVDGLRESGIKV